MAALNRAVVRRVESTRTIDPGYALVEQTSASVGSLCDASCMQIVVSSSSGPPMLVTPPIGGITRLLLRSDVASDPTARTFAINTGSQLCWRPQPCTDEEVARLVGLAGVFHATLLSDASTEGISKQKIIVERLRDVPGLWGPTSLQELLTRLDPILPRLRAEEPDQNPSISAAELNSVARDVRDRSADYVLAETLFKRAVIAAGREQDWEEQVRALLGWGRAIERTGRIGVAGRKLRAALRCTWRHDLRAVRGEVLHDLFSLAVEAEADCRALHWASEAYSAYGPEHPNIPRFAQDVGCHLLQQGYYLRAFRIFAALLRLDPPDDWLPCALSNYALAAAGSGRVEAYEWAAHRLRGRLHKEEGGAYTARAYLALAEGAVLLSAWVNATACADAAMRLAIRNGERRTLNRAEAVLDRGAQRCGLPDPIRSKSPAAGMAWEELVLNLELAMREYPSQAGQSLSA